MSLTELMVDLTSPISLLTTCLSLLTVSFFTTPSTSKLQHDLDRGHVPVISHSLMLSLLLVVEWGTGWISQVLNHPALEEVRCILLRTIVQFLSGNEYNRFSATFCRCELFSYRLIFCLVFWQFWSLKTLSLSRYTLEPLQNVQNKVFWLGIKTWGKYKLIEVYNIAILTVNNYDSAEGII